MAAARTALASAPRRGGARAATGFSLDGDGRWADRGADTEAPAPVGWRWSLAGLVPLVDVEGYDVARSAAGRCGAEAIWAPAAVLPAPEVVWTADDDRHLRVRFAVGDTPVDLHLHLDESGHLRAFRTMRWGDPDGTRRWGAHPFGGRVSEIRRFGTSIVPARGAVGWYPDGPDARRREFLRFRLTALAPTTPGP